MFLAPLAVLLVPVGIVLWPPTVLLLGIAWVVTWPLSMVPGVRDHRHVIMVRGTIGRWFRTVLTPWTFFDPPDRNRSSP